MNIEISYQGPIWFFVGSNGYQTGYGDDASDQGPTFQQKHSMIPLDRGLLPVFNQLEGLGLIKSSKALVGQRPTA